MEPYQNIIKINDRVTNYGKIIDGINNNETKIRRKLLGKKKVLKIIINAIKVHIIKKIH